MNTVLQIDLQIVLKAFYLKIKGTFIFPACMFKGVTYAGIHSSLKTTNALSKLQTLKRVCVYFGFARVDVNSSLQLYVNSSRFVLSAHLV